MVTITEPHPHRARRLGVETAGERGQRDGGRGMGRGGDKVEIKEKKEPNGNKMEKRKKRVNYL